MTEHFSFGRLQWTRVTYELRFWGFILEAIYCYISGGPSTIPKSNDFLHLITEKLFSCLKFVCRTERSCVDSCWGNMGRQRRCENCWKIKYLSFIAVEKKNARNSITFAGTEMKFVAELTTMSRFEWAGEAPSKHILKWLCHWWKA